MKKFNKIDTLSKLLKEGFSIDTLLKFNNEQLQVLSNKVLGEAKVTISKEDLLKNLPPDETIEVEVTEEEDIDPRYPEPKTYRDSEGQEKKILEKELPEEIMDMGAGDFDDTSFYNPYAGGFDDSQGPMDSYYSTDNKGRFVRNGMKGDGGRYSKNAKYLDTPSFNNPDARGFDSYGPTDSYGGNGWDEGGFAGEMNEDDVDTIHPYKGQQTQAPKQVGPSTDDGGKDYQDGMGMFERYFTKKQIMEKTNKNNPWAICTESLGLTGKKEEDYTKTEAEKKERCIKGVKKSTGYKSESIDKRMVENWLIGLVEKYERPSMTKSQFLQTLNEIAVETQDIEVIDNDVEDSKHELPSWMDFNTLLSSTETKPTIKPGTKEPKPKRRNPFRPKPGKKPAPKAKTKKK